MAKKRGARRDASPAKPKQLRKRLRKAEDQLEDARAKRDRAQARLDALAIIADEIRAQLAELGEAEDGPADGPADAAEESAEATAAEPASEVGAQKKPAKAKAKAKSRTDDTKPQSAKASLSRAEKAADEPSPEAPIAGQAAGAS